MITVNPGGVVQVVHVILTDVSLSASTIKNDPLCFLYHFIGLYIFLWCCSILDEPKRRSSRNVLQGRALYKIFYASLWVGKTFKMIMDACIILKCVFPVRSCMGLRTRLEMRIGDAFLTSFPFHSKKDLQPSMGCRCYLIKEVRFPWDFLS